MKLSIESYTLMQKLGDFEGLKAIKQAGFDCVDMSYYWQEDDAPLVGEGYREYALRLRAYLDELGLTCNQAHAPLGFKYHWDFDQSTPRYRSIVRAIESAAILGAKTIVLHSLVLKKDSQIIVDRARNFDFFKSLQPFCERFNIRIAVENLFAFDEKRSCYRGRFGTPEELCSFVRELNSPYFVACVDVGHAAITGSEPEHFLAGMNAEILQALHIQDGDYRGDRHTVPFLGDFKWTEIMQALKKIGYEGDLTFEIVKYLQNIPNELLSDALRFAERVGRHLIAIFEGEACV